MSGVLGMLAAGGADVLSGEVENPSGTNFRYTNAALTAAVIRGAQLDNATSIGPTLKFRLGLSSVVAATFFSRIIVQASDGSYVTLNASDAEFSNPLGTRSSWDWSGTALWDSTHASRTIQVYY